MEPWGSEDTMNDELSKELSSLAADDVVELSDELLDSIAGGYIYHDKGDATAHRKEAFYVLDSKGKIIMKLGDIAKAEHWAGNLRTSLHTLTTEEFEKLRLQ